MAKPKAQMREDNKDRPSDPEARRFGEWSQANIGIYNAFRDWLKATGFSPSALNIYSVAARYALGYLDKPYWVIDPETDLELVRQRICARYPSPGTQRGYRKGLKKFGEFLRLRCHRLPKPKKINWQRFTGSLPGWLADDVGDYLHHIQRNWPEARRNEIARTQLSHLTRSLRWMAARYTLKEIAAITPEIWFAYLDERLAQGIQAATINTEFSHLRRFLGFLEERGQPICTRLLRVQYLDSPKLIPKDVPPAQLRILQAEIQRLAASEHGLYRRMGRLDLAWFLLMLHSGLRTCEVRQLGLGDIDWGGRKLRIEQSKGLKARIVYLGAATLQALQAYLEVRGPAETLPENLFIYRHRRLSQTYCQHRLRTYGKRCGVRATPHQLRHSCATLLLNAGAPILTVKLLLGHKRIETTLGYARLYDGTVAADYFRAMALVERQIALPEDQAALPPSHGELIALVDSLRTGTLNDRQQEVIWQLRAGLMSLAEQQGELVEVSP